MSIELVILIHRTTLNAGIFKLPKLHLGTAPFEYLPGLTTELVLYGY